MTKELLNQALEYLEDNQHWVADGERHAYVMEYNAFIDKLKQALAQPKQEPLFKKIIDQHPGLAEELKAMDEQEQEPVYLIWSDDMEGWAEGDKKQYDLMPEEERWLLYTTPPQRKPLTHEKEIALREGYFADAEKTYFEARADCLNSAQNRRLFEAGFKRGWEAAQGIKE